MIYLTDVGQREHFEMVFSAAKRAGWLPPNENDYPKASHVGFGLVLGKMGNGFVLEVQRWLSWLICLMMPRSGVKQHLKKEVRLKIDC